MVSYFKEFFAKQPEKIIEWFDTESTARGWLVINSLRGNAAGGGTRMKPGCTKQEVINLAKTMEIKFAISGPAIGGAKSGIDYEPKNEKEKHDILRRWFRFIEHELKTEYGTGGDYNVDQRRDVIPLLAELGIQHSQEGIVRGHFAHLSHAIQNKIIKQLYTGVSLPISDPLLSKYHYCIADIITGYGVIQSLSAYYDAHHDSIQNKRIIIEGFGNVGAAAAYFATQAGARVVGVMEKTWYMLNSKGVDTSKLFSAIKNNNFEGVQQISPRISNIYTSQEADVFIPAATSGTITATRLGELENLGVQIIACGANNPFDTAETLGKADSMCTVIPDFIANAGMARTFAYLMEPNCLMTVDAIYQDVSQLMHTVINEICNNVSTNSSFYLGAEQAVMKRLGQSVSMT